ncbi:MAG: ubiquinone/menaquinone biosynthesis methyltransferase [Armatimonadota bacterium]|nr:ubiquinone/menaquinone biosynthesis methyltransferase [Armatimonadota bacterium]MDR7466181.1 ubiquinone/menaquinone biosynthesis methyltransferase [Armatimonadota bacterium]MDR7495136.1 ubiquinone/menaquinone biosynthesis methyltransferase [Armatimonadota bacterium]MDR7505794.1 ubiquinone/menaquinone biosynthesis methyltransferase [Armatimonadota bacterium]MDR7546196.1 ubiquinone/menaquinone biosynthesis methyltransferase [Armatimonadota bacterium]
MEVQRTKAMFAAIARRYDLANSVLSAGLHHAWKRRAVAAAGLRRGERVLDAGAGTGDLARLAVAQGAQVTAVDVSLEMMAVARMKLGAEAGLRCVGGDIADLPFRGGSFDAVLTAFTLRHPTRLDEALRELMRVLIPGGRLVILEFARPLRPWTAAAYRVYAALIPAIGGWLTGDADAYTYLVESIRRFPAPPVLAGMLRAVGLRDVAYQYLTGGIVAIYTAIRPW